MKESKSLRKFCDEQDLLRLAYTSTDGHPRAVPVWFAKVKGEYYVGTYKSSPKWKAISQSTGVGWVIDGGRGRKYKGISECGTAEEITDKKLRNAVYRALANKYFGRADHPQFKKIYGEKDDAETVYFRLKPHKSS